MFLRKRIRAAANPYLLDAFPLLTPPDLIDHLRWRGLFFQEYQVVLIVLVMFKGGDRCGHVSLLQDFSVFLNQVYSELSKRTIISTLSRRQRVLLCKF